MKDDATTMSEQNSKLDEEQPEILNDLEVSRDSADETKAGSGLKRGVDRDKVLWDWF